MRVCYLKQLEKNSNKCTFTSVSNESNLKVEDVKELLSRNLGDIFTFLIPKEKVLFFNVTQFNAETILSKLKEYLKQSGYEVSSGNHNSIIYSSCTKAEALIAYDENSSSIKEYW